MVAVSEKRVDYAYDLVGQMDWVKRYSDLAGSSAVASTDYSFDLAGRLSEIDHRDGSTPGSGTQVAGYGYTWSQRNQLSAIDFLPSAYDDEDVDYTYDARGQLDTAVFGDTDLNEDYDYDSNGNRTEVTNTAGVDQDYDTTADNRLLFDGTYHYSYDAEGNRSRKFIDVDDSNTYTAGDTVVTAYYWDHRNRLVLISEHPEWGQGGTQGVEYYYDAMNQLVRRRVDPDGSSGSDPWEHTVFVWENGQIVMQLQDEGTDWLTEADLTNRYLWGPGVDQLLADEQIDWSDSDADGEVLWSLADHLSSVRDVVDNNGTVRIHRDFDSFGNVQSETHYNASGNTVTSGQAGYVSEIFGYTGKLFEVYTDLQYNNARWYDAKVGRWISKDYIWDGTNRYAYGNNAPTVFVDPTGLANLWNPISWFTVSNPHQGWGEFFNPFSAENRAFVSGGARGAANSIVGAAKGCKEVAYQGIDAVGSATEIVSGGAYHHDDWSGTMQGLNSGQIGLGGYYLNIGTFGVWGQGQAVADYINGNISVDELSQQIGGTAIFQAGGAYLMNRMPSRAPTRPPLAGVLEGHGPGQGFSGVYDAASGRVGLCPSTSSSPLPRGWVPRQGGHADVSAALGGNPANHVGFATVLQDGGRLTISWRSRTLNPPPDFLVPSSLRPSIIDAVQRATGYPVR
jgi:RHS repeat-associated protein